MKIYIILLYYKLYKKYLHMVQQRVWEQTINVQKYSHQEKEHL